jgi:hypothetical protein
MVSIGKKVVVRKLEDSLKATHPAFPMALTPCISSDLIKFQKAEKLPISN